MTHIAAVSPSAPCCREALEPSEDPVLVDSGDVLISDLRAHRPERKLPLQGSTLFAWHSHGIPWCGIGFHGTPWGVPWHATSGTRATPAATATALHGMSWPPPRHPNVHGTSMFTAPRLGLGLGIGVALGLGFHGMPWRSVEGSVVYRGRCRGRFAVGDATACHGMSRHVVKKGYNVHPLRANSAARSATSFGTAEAAGTC